MNESTPARKWLTKAEAAGALHVSERTIDNWIAAHRLSTRPMPMPGRRTATVIDPDDVDRVRAEQNKGAILPPLQPSMTTTGNELTMLAHVARLFAPQAAQTGKVYLTLDEASEHTSLPVRLLRRFIRDGRLPAATFHDGGAKRIWVKRSDVENIDFAVPAKVRKDFGKGAE